MMPRGAKRKLSICISSLGIVFSVGAYAQTTHAVAVGGAGRDSCAIWIKDRGGASEPSVLASQKRIEWISGFFSAVNLFTQPSGNLPGGIDDIDGMLGWIDTHCRSKPDEPLWAAAADLVLDLKNHPRK
jgi:hypothetical protein